MTQLFLFIVLALLATLGAACAKTEPAGTLIPTSTLVAPPASSPSLTSTGAATGWTRQFGTPGRDEGSDAVVDGAGNLYVVGSTQASIPGKRNAFVSKYDNQGKELWTRQFALHDYNGASGVAVDGEGNPYVVGFTGKAPGQAGGRIEIDVMVRKYDGQGKELWTRQFYTPGNDEASDAATDREGNLYVVGITGEGVPGPTGLSDSEAFVRKYDSIGNELWARQLGSEGEWDRATAVAVDLEGYVYVVGSREFKTPREAFVRKYDGQGNELWRRQIGAAGAGVEVDVYGTTAAGVAVDHGGNVFVVGGDSGAAFVVKYNHDGNELWKRRFGSELRTQIHDIQLDSSGNLYVVGGASGALPGQTYLGSWDAFVRKFDTDGNEVWTYQFGTQKTILGRRLDTDFEDVARGVALDTAGNLYVVGSTTGSLFGQTNLGLADAFVVKMSADHPPAPTPIPTPPPRLSVEHDLIFERPDGSQVRFTPETIVGCARGGGDEVSFKSISVFVGLSRNYFSGLLREEKPRPPPGSHWTIEGIIDDVKDGQIIEFPNIFIWDQPKGATFFVFDPPNELSSGSGYPDAGWLAFHKLGCNVGDEVEFSVDALLGSEFHGGDPLLVRGTFRGRVTETSEQFLALLNSPSTPAPIAFPTPLPTPARPAPTPIAFPTPLPTPARPASTPIAFPTPLPTPARPAPTPIAFPTPLPPPAPHSTPIPAGSLVMRHLVVLDQGSILPDLARAWERSVDGLSWTFEIRQGVRTPNDDELDSRIVQGILEAHKDGIRGYLQSESIDAQRIQITLRYPNTQLLNDLSTIEIQTKK